MLRIGRLKNGYQFWQKGEGQKERFQYCLNPIYLTNSCTLEQFKDIQGVLSILHGKELRSIMNHGWIPGGVSPRTGRQVFFTFVNPMDNQDGLGETQCDVSQARIAPCKNTWNLKLAQQRGLQFYQTRSNAVILYDTLPAEFIEKAMCMKTEDQLYQMESVILGPRVVLEANSHSGSRSKIILGIATRLGELRGNPKQHC